MAQIDVATMLITNVLVVVAHPDDIESWCAGTVCRFTDAGKHVAYVLCTSGDKGTSDPTQTPQQVAAMLVGALAAIVTAIDNPARQAFLSDLVSKDALLNAVALNASVYNGAAVIGPSLAGLLLLRIGAPGCFL